jgi:hypothetical protein
MCRRLSWCGSRSSFQQPDTRILAISAPSGTHRSSIPDNFDTVFHAECHQSGTAGPVGQCQTAYQAYVATGTGPVAVNALYSTMQAQCSGAAAAVAPVQNVRMDANVHVSCAAFRLQWDV